ncbi:hypothetical protein ACFFMR_24395 [Micromonospora andamanensis]|uniref:Uncharacterized protein n=1 Tax=Micromonospora andamanensis TaxID=1287068 RepID=A0ABQ4I462_9ACTN|nr:MULTISPECIES: hypothetical protein [Micromonospora]GIJ12694.1 hypothetical protein Van01_59080 [Micromonospora andamanensis]
MSEITEVVETEITEQATPEVEDSAEAAEVRQPSTRVMCCDQAV